MPAQILDDLADNLSVETGSNSVAECEIGYLKSEDSLDIGLLQSINSSGGGEDLHDGHTSLVTGESKTSVSVGKQEELVSTRDLVGIDGKWYDVTHFVDKHPGGNIIRQFIGKDATSAFKAFGHPEEVLKYRKPVGTYDRRVDPVTSRFEELIESFKREGLYDTYYFFYLQRLALGFGFMFLAFFMVIYFESLLIHLLAPVVLMTGGQQFGYIMHETMHKQIVRKGTGYHCLGAIVGTAFTGFSSLWWQAEHNEHHAATNMVDYETKFIDPQMYEECWVQDKLLFPLFTPPKSWFQQTLISVQHITYIPFVLFLSRCQIIFDSFKGEKHWWEWVGGVFYFTWIFYFFSFLPNWPERFVCLFIYNANGGFIHFLFTLSHYCRKFHSGDEFHTKSWYQSQIESNMNLNIFSWMTWWYGGLNFHVEHHLFPTMARNMMWTANIEVQKACQEFQIDYQSVTLFEAFKRTVEHFKSVALMYDQVIKDRATTEGKKIE